MVDHRTNIVDIGNISSYNFLIQYRKGVKHMALIKCPECGRENVSDSAATCPTCGYGIKEHFEKVKAEDEERRRAQEKAQKEFENQQRIKLMCTPEKQRETIERLKKEKRNATVSFTVCVVIMTAFILLAFFVWLSGMIDDSITLLIISLFGAFFGFLGTIDGYDKLSTAEADLAAAEEGMDKYYEQLQNRMQKAVASLAQSVAEENAKRPICPNCGSRNTERITTWDRTTSIALTGLASSKIGKQYQCKKCKHKW